MPFTLLITSRSRYPEIMRFAMPENTVAITCRRPPFPLPPQAHAGRRTARHPSCRRASTASSWLMNAKSSGPVMPSSLAAQSRQRYGLSMAGRYCSPRSSARYSSICSMSSRNFRNIIQVSIGNRSRSLLTVLCPSA